LYGGISPEPHAGYGRRQSVLSESSQATRATSKTITLDGFEPSHAALRRMGMRNEFNYRWENPVKIRSCPYLNNIVEQDHRRVKFRVQPMLGFKTFSNARRVLIGIELMQKIIKGQFRVPAHFASKFGSSWRTALAS
jgi:transposase-like protein